MPRLETRAGLVIILARAGRIHPEYSAVQWQAHSNGQNLRFADGHTRWYKACNTNEMTFRYNSMSGWN
jgi:hypothetical protein